jgi:N-acetylglucosaminyldiphosphoundecaprenol N-acetyl-beta-D-mannosaminyltransferase
MYPLLFKELTRTGNSIFLLGSEQNVIEKAFVNLKRAYPKVNILGFHSGYFNQDEENELVDKLNKLNPDLLILGMGFIKEADFIMRNFDKLNFKVIWNVGGLFDFISGRYKRAPKLLLKLRLEWLYRFIQAPVQKFERTFIVPFWFLFKLFNINFDSK